MEYPFEADLAEIEADPEPFVTAVFSSLESEFLVLPKGEDYVDYATFERGYEALKAATVGFSSIQAAPVQQAAQQTPIIAIVLRTILGFTPPEWAYVTSERTGVKIREGFVRHLDRSIRRAPLTPLSMRQGSSEQLEALIAVACQLISMPAPEVRPTQIHRLDKADTREGAASVRALARMGCPYAMLLYERYLGRPFAGHRDSVSELVGDVLESAIEDELARAGISYRKTKRAERVASFDQAPDFIVPSEFNPQVVIEAKVNQDPGTARDKVTRIQHLAELSMRDRPQGPLRFEVVACIAGRGFEVRREDMRKLLVATRGKVFTLSTLDRLVENTRLREFRTASPA